MVRDLLMESNIIIRDCSNFVGLDGKYFPCCRQDKGGKPETLEYIEISYGGHLEPLLQDGKIRMILRGNMLPNKWTLLLSFLNVYIEIFILSIYIIRSIAVSRTWHKLSLTNQIVTVCNCLKLGAIHEFFHTF